MSYKPNYDVITKDYNNSLNILSGGNFTPVKRKREHQKEMAAYHNKTSQGTTGVRQEQAPAANDVTPKQEKSSFEQWNIEKTQPKLSYGQEKLIQSYNSAGSPWLDASMRKYATRQMQASDVDKQSAGGYNKSEYKSPAYARQMSYRGMQRGAYNTDKPGDRRNAGTNREFPTYSPQTQQAIIKDGLDSAAMKYNGRNYMQLSDAYDREEEALNYLADNIVYGSNLDDDLIGSWVTRQDAAEKWLADVFGEGKKNELSKRLQKKLNSVTLEEKQKNAGKYKDYTSKDFALPDAKKYKQEHNIGGEDEELKTWETVLDILQAGLDAAGVIPGVGVAPDLVNAAIYAIRGDWLNAGLSAKKQRKENNNYNENVPDVLKLANETKNMIQTYVENVHFNKEVIPKSYYVDKNIPDTKYGIKLSDAAIMAELSYYMADNGELYGEMKQNSQMLNDDWKLVDNKTIRKGLNMNVYEHIDEYTGEKSYVIVNRGTEISSLIDWRNNAEQIYGESDDMKNSIRIAKEIIKEYGEDVPITFVGHSKGGAEAMANAIATNRNAIVFNAAKLYPDEYGLDTEGYTGNISSYIVDGDILNSIQDNYNSNIADTTYLQRQHRIYPSPLSGVINIWNGVQNHSMKSVIDALKGK